MSIKPILSICIPTYNRKKKLRYLLNSIDLFNRIEVVIIDDGSTDGIKNFLKTQKYPFVFKFYRTNVNRGRSSALADSIKFSTGTYIIIMDSDDYFLPGAINSIITTLKKHKTIKSFVFGIKTMKNRSLQKQLPPDLETNLLKLRADFKVKGDFKEVVRADILKKCIYKKSYKFRRTPTSLMWFNVSNLCKCITVNIPIIFKAYEKTGMSSSIAKLKYENAEPMRDIYYKYSQSKLYDSIFFRVRSKILFYRYSYLSKKKFNFKLYELIYILIGYSIYIIDSINYKFVKKFF